jgi:phosphatidylserine decarboxylase
MMLVLGAVAVVGPVVLGWWASPLTTLCVIVVLWGLWFFRDPERTPPQGADLVISPADGRVIKIDEAMLPPEVRAGVPDAGTMTRIAVFLNIFNVHVNRAPVSGRVLKVVHTPGQFLTASLDKASEQNERSVVLMREAQGRTVAFAQIAGLVARRIVNHLRDGQNITCGERFGLIRFGSRAEIYLPRGTIVNVRVGEGVVAGRTVLATLPAIDRAEAANSGEVLAGAGA